MGKRLAIITIRVDDEERQRLTESAAAAQQTVSEYIRSNAMKQRSAQSPRTVAPVANLGKSHIDELGPDPLRGRDKALAA